MGLYETVLRCSENGDNCVIVTSTIDMSSGYIKICEKHSPNVGNKIVYSLNAFVFEYSKRYVNCEDNFYEIEILETYEINRNRILKCKLEKTEKILSLLSYLDSSKMKYFSWFNYQPSWLIKDDSIELILIWYPDNLFVR